MAEVLLFAVGGLAVLDDVFTVAVVADDDLSNHSWILSFGLDPLPIKRLVLSRGRRNTEWLFRALPLNPSWGSGSSCSPWPRQASTCTWPSPPSPTSGS